MSDGHFQEAYARVRGRYSEQAWISLTPRQITDAIYREIRLMDAERLQHDGQSGRGLQVASAAD